MNFIQISTQKNVGENCTRRQFFKGNVTKTITINHTLKGNIVQKINQSKTSLDWLKKSKLVKKKETKLYL